MDQENMEKGKYVQYLLKNFEKNEHYHPIYLMLMCQKRPGVKYDEEIIDVKSHNEIIFMKMFYDKYGHNDIENFKKMVRWFFLKHGLPLPPEEQVLAEKNAAQIRKLRLFVAAVVIFIIGFIIYAIIK